MFRVIASVPQRDLEAAIHRELERFLLELGTDFGFIARQKRMTIGNRAFYLDQPYLPPQLRRMVAIGEKNREQIELLQLDRGEIRVAEYLVELPPREMLEAKLHEAIRLARGQVVAREEKPRRRTPGS
ncbi:MAG: PDDEXK nuclease domain-containing protein [Methanothrix sp.]